MKFGPAVKLGYQTYSAVCWTIVASTDGTRFTGGQMRAAVRIGGYFPRARRTVSSTSRCATATSSTFSA